MMLDKLKPYAVIDRCIHPVLRDRMPDRLVKRFWTWAAAQECASKLSTKYTRETGNPSEYWMYGVVTRQEASNLSKRVWTGRVEQ